MIVLKDSQGPAAQTEPFKTGVYQLASPNFEHFPQILIAFCTKSGLKWRFLIFLAYETAIFLQKNIEIPSLQYRFTYKFGLYTDITHKTSEGLKFSYKIAFMAYKTHL